MFEGELASSPRPKTHEASYYETLELSFLNFQLPFHFFDSRDLPRTYLVGPADPLDNSGTGARRRAATPTDQSAIARYDVFVELVYFSGSVPTFLGLYGSIRDLPRTYLVGPADPLDNSGTGTRRRAPTPTDMSAIARYDVFEELAYFSGSVATFLDFSLKVIHRSLSWCFKMLEVGRRSLNIHGKLWTKTKFSIDYF